MKKVRFALLFIAFNLILVFLLTRIDHVFKNKSVSGAQELFAKWNPEHADIVFIGNSHNFCTVSTDLLYDEYGIESFMLSTSAQTIPMSYYAAMEAIELKHPDKIVLEISYVPHEHLIIGSGMDHCFFDDMPRCKARKLALEDLIDEEERIYYILPLGYYHSRWRELHKEDYEDADLSYRGTFTNNRMEDSLDNIPVAPEGEELPIPEITEEYLLKIFDLCKETGTELILYVAPFGSNESNKYSEDILLNAQRNFNYVCRIAKEQGIRAYNLFYELDNLELVFGTDWMDRQHLNLFGQEKVTRYMADRGYFSD
ncbi:MAG: hypothetical protein K6E32_07485 [Lachnospiraceae bacterium]|nr:hypothetical protein [Lachnospiraceae bacterium]